MTTRALAQRVPLAAEIALAFLAGAGTFALVAVVVGGVESDALVVLLGVPFVAAIVAVARHGGVVYAVPIAMAGMLAYDWYYLPPTHPLEIPDSANLVDLLVYLSVAVLIGELAAQAARRAEASEAARGELAEEQAALRRVATLVARAVPARELLAAVAEQAGTLLDVDATRIARYDDEEEIVHVAQWSKSGYDPPSFDRAKLEGKSVSAEVLRTGRVARIDDYDDIEERLAFTRGLDVKSVVGAPIVVEGRRWGVMVAWSATEALPGDAEARLTDFTELVATAISNTEARTETSRLANEQAALRRVATLVARGVPPLEVFETVTREVGLLCGADLARMERYEPDATVTGVGGWSKDGGQQLAVGTRFALEGVSIAVLAQETSRPVRIDSFDQAFGPIAREAQELGIRSSVGCPIVVEGHLWGVIAASSKSEAAFPADTESQIGEFTELVATAISNTEARVEVSRLAEEQAALRRVATLIAQERPPAEVFATVAEEVARLLHVDATAMLRYESDGTATFVAEWSERESPSRVGETVPVEGNNISAEVSNARRLDDIARGCGTGPLAATAAEMGIRSSAVGPIMVEGRLWGVMIAMSLQPEPLPPETESRIAQFTDLVATGIANTEARAEVGRLAEEQAALRRVATLVAHGASPTAVFDAVAAEVARVLDAERLALCHYEPDAGMTVVAHHGEQQNRLPGAPRVTLEGENVAESVLRTGRPARIDNRERSSGSIATISREARVRSAVGSPIVVEGRLWGVMIASWTAREPRPADTEERMTQFAELVDTAIANADSRAQLIASRARVLAAGDDARRHVVRDLHDGAQQRLVHTIVTLKLAQRALRQNDGAADSLVAEALDQANQGNAELRELAHGILPSVLTRGGLRAGVDALVSRLDFPVTAHVSDKRFPAGIEASAYFVVAEALTNVVKHSRAQRADVRASVDDGVLHIEVRDDGVGGAIPDGTGLIGLDDRVVALGGRLRVESPPGEGTLVAAALPLPG